MPSGRIDTDLASMGRIGGITGRSMPRWCHERRRRRATGPGGGDVSYWEPTPCWDGPSEMASMRSPLEASSSSWRAMSARATMPTRSWPSITGRRRTLYWAIVFRASWMESSAPMVTGLPSPSSPARVEPGSLPLASALTTMSRSVSTPFRRLSSPQIGIDPKPRSAIFLAASSRVSFSPTHSALGVMTSRAVFGICVAPSSSVVLRISLNPSPGSGPSNLGKRRLVEALTQVGERLQHGHGPGLAELLLGEAAGEDGHGRDLGPGGGLAVPGRVADQHRLAAPDLVHGRVDQVRVGLGPLDVGRGRPGLDQLAGVQQVEVVLDLVALARAGQDQPVPAPVQQLQQPPGVGERLHLADQVGVQGGLGRPDAVALAVLDPLAGHGGHQLVAAHADVAVDPPHRQGQPVLAEGAVPGDGVVVVGVDQGAVDVQQRDRLRHRRSAQRRSVLARASACSRWTPSANSSTSLALNAGRSSGLRLVTRPRSVWTSSSTQAPPAFSMSVRMLGHEVRVRPLTTSASTSVHGPWQMAATGLPDSKNDRTKSTASASLRRKSGLATPPGRTSPS